MCEVRSEVMCEVRSDVMGEVRSEVPPFIVIVWDVGS